MSNRTRTGALLLALAAASPLSALAQQASLTVSCGIGSTCNATNTEWSLSKAVASQDATSATFTVSVSKGATSDAIITYTGTLTIANTGSAPASVGSVLVNLQRKYGKNWKTVSTDVANSTLGDAATSALICSPASSEGLSSFNENAASGSIEFTDADSNTLFSINSPAFSLGAGESKTLTYVAHFNNTQLGIPAGELTRAEAIVTFANAGGRGGSGASCGNVDADGSGNVDGVERWVRSVPCRTTVAMATLEASNSSVVVTDFAEGVTTTGTVTMTGFTTDMGEASGSAVLGDSAAFSVVTTVDAGTDGGTLTNRARLDAETLPACNAPVALTAEATATFTVDDNPPPPPNLGAYCSYTQGGWGAKPNGNNPATTLAGNFGTVYPSGVTVGGAKTMTFTSALGVQNYLPAGGTPGSLTANLTNPTSSSSGVFGGQVLALQLNVDMSTYGVTPAGYGDVVVDGTWTVNDVLAAANAALGGAGAYTPGDLNELVDNLNNAMDNCTTTSWAAAHLSEPAPK
jgi:hypothetical protein